MPVVGNAGTSGGGMTTSVVTVVVIGSGDG